MIAAATLLHAERPVTSTERARDYAKCIRKPTPTPPLDVSKALEGQLRDLKEFCDGFEARLAEPRVGEFMKASAATRGKLYDLRAQLA